MQDWLTCPVVHNDDADKDALNCEPEHILGPVKKDETQPWSVHHYQVSTWLRLGGHIDKPLCIL